jgi:hypothetical protein
MAGPEATVATEATDPLEEIKTRLDKLTVLTAQLVTVVETRRVLVEGFDDRLARAESLERSLGTTALKIAAARALTSWVSGAIAGGVAGGVVAWIILASHIVLTR